MKSFWDKATELGSKAKNFATDYLGNPLNGNRILNENDKIEGEKFLSLKKEIDSFKIETIKTAEEKIKKFSKKLEEVINEKETILKTNEEMILSLESNFCEKEKDYLIQISNMEKELKLKEENILETKKLNENVKEQNDICNILFFN